jgi:hypothetical protein
MKHKFYIHKRYIALAFGALLFLSGCQSAELKALESSVSIIQLQTGREVNRLMHDKELGFTRTIYPELIIQYEPINDYTKKDVYDEIVAILEKNNWERSDWNIGRSDFFTASLRQGRFTISASVVIYTDKNLVQITMLSDESH